MLGLYYNIKPQDTIGSIKASFALYRQPALVSFTGLNNHCDDSLMLIQLSRQYIPNSEDGMFYQYHDALLSLHQGFVSLVDYPRYDLFVERGYLSGYIL